MRPIDPGEKVTFHKDRTIANVASEMLALLTNAGLQAEDVDKVCLLMWVGFAKIREESLSSKVEELKTEWGRIGGHASSLIIPAA